MRLSQHGRVQSRACLARRAPLGAEVGYSQVSAEAIKVSPNSLLVKSCWNKEVPSVVRCLNKAQ